MNRYQVRDAAHGLEEHVVSFLEALDERGLGAGDREQALIGNGDQRVDVRLELPHAVVGLLHAALALEDEGLGHHPDGERAELLRHPGDDRRGPGARPAAHAGRDEDHVGSGEMLAEPLDVLLRGVLADRGVAAGPEAAGGLLAELQLHGRKVGAECLRVGVGRDEVDARQSGRDHRVHRVAATPADSHHLDPRPLAGIDELHHRRPSCSTTRLGPRCSGRFAARAFVPRAWR